MRDESTELQADLAPYREGGIHHAALLKGDAGARAGREAVFRKHFPEDPGAAPPPAAPSGKAEDDTHPEAYPPKCDSTSPDDLVAEEELKQRWKESYDSKLKDFQETRDVLLPASDKTADAIYNRLVDHLPNDVELIDVLSKAKSRIDGFDPSSNPSLNGLSESKKDMLAAQAVTRLFGKINSPVVGRVYHALKDIPENELRDWAAKLAMKFNQERK